MILTLRQIEYVVQVAECGSISAASRQLRISQSSVLAAIELSEATSGIRIFDRQKGRGIATTPAGQKFLVAARRFLSAGADFHSSLDGLVHNENQTIRIGCYSPLGALLIPPVAKRMLVNYPGTEFILHEGDQIELKNLLAQGILDVVVTYDIGEDYGKTITPICKCPAHALVHCDDPLANKTSVSMDDLSDRPLVLLDLPGTEVYLMALFDFSARRPKISFRTRSYETLRAAIVNGLGISVLNFKPHHESSPDSVQLRRVPISDPLKQPTLLVADLYGNNKPAYVEAFISCLYQYISEIGTENFSVCKPEFSKNMIYPRPKF